MNLKEKERKKKKERKEERTKERKIDLEYLLTSDRKDTNKPKISLKTSLMN